MWYCIEVERAGEQEIDAFELPILPLRRVCAKRGCRADARPGGGRLCREHHAASMRRWRDGRQRAGETLAGASPRAPSSSREAVCARVALHRARRRGLTATHPCVVCTRREGVVAVHLDPANPQNVAWACRGCRYELVRGQHERRTEAEREAEHRAQNERNASELQAALDAIGTLAADIAAALRAEAAKGPYPFPLRPETLLYQMRLAAAVRRFKAGL